MLAERGLDDAGLLVVEETALEGGRLPARALAPVRAWLDGLAADGQSRAALVRRTLTGALDSLPAASGSSPRALAEQADTAAALREDAEQAYARGLDEVDEAVRSGALLRGEVLARWHDVIGTGDLMRALESRLGRLRDRVRSFVTGAPAAEQELRTAVESSVDAVDLRGGGPRRGARRRARGAGGRPGARCWRARPASTPPPPICSSAPARRCARGRERCSSSSARRRPASARPRASPPWASTAPGSW